MYTIDLTYVGAVNHAYYEANANVEKWAAQNGIDTMDAYFCGYILGWQESDKLKGNTTHCARFAVLDLDWLRARAQMHDDGVVNKNTKTFDRDGNKLCFRMAKGTMHDLKRLNTYNTFYTGAEPYKTKGVNVGTKFEAELKQWLKTNPVNLVTGAYAGKKYEVISQGVSELPQGLDLIIKAIDDNGRERYFCFEMKWKDHSNWL